MMDWVEGKPDKIENGMQVELKNGEKYFIGEYEADYNGKAAHDSGCGCCSDGLYLNEIVRYRKLV